MMKFISKICFFIAAIYCSILSAETTYQFERMWPNLPQPWYFGEKTTIESDEDGNFYSLLTTSDVVSKFDSNGNLIRTWDVKYEKPSNNSVDDALQLVGKSLYIIRTSYEATGTVAYLLEYDLNGDEISETIIPPKVGDIKLFEGGESIDSFAIDNSNNLYLYAFNGGVPRLVKYNLDSTEATSLTTTYGTSKPGEFVRMDISSEGILYVVRVDYSQSNLNADNSYTSYIDEYSQDGTIKRRHVTAELDRDRASIGSPRDIEIHNNTVLISMKASSGDIHNVDVYELPDFTFVKSIPLKFSFQISSVSALQLDMANNEFFYVSQSQQVKKVRFSSGEVESDWSATEKSVIGEDNNFLMKRGYSGLYSVHVDANDKIYIDASKNNLTESSTNTGSVTNAKVFNDKGIYLGIHPLYQNYDYTISATHKGFIFDSNNNQFYATHHWDNNQGLGPEISKVTSSNELVKTVNPLLGEPATQGENRNIFLDVDHEDNLYVVGDIHWYASVPTYESTYTIEKYDNDLTLQWRKKIPFPPQFNVGKGYIDGIGITKNFIYISTIVNGIERISLDGEIMSAPVLWDGQYNVVKDLKVFKEKLYVLFHQGIEIYDLANLHNDLDRRNTPVTTIDFASDTLGIQEPISFDILSDGRIAVVDNELARVQLIKPVEKLSNAKAIIIAGGGPYTSNSLWNATLMNANYAYRTLRGQGYTKDRIQYFAEEDFDLDNNGVKDDFEGFPTKQNIQYAIETWGADADNVVVYMIDHGGVNTFRLSETTILDVDDLKVWLEKLEGNMSGGLTVVYDACKSGSFIDELQGDGRTIVTSSNVEENAYFLANGAISFSSFFWTDIFNGQSLGNSFEQARLKILANAAAPQIPQISVNGVLLSDDLSSVNSQYLGNGTVYVQDAPTINAVSDDQYIEGVTTADLSATGVNDDDGIQKVWGVIFPPSYTYSSSSVDAPVLDLPMVFFSKTSDTDNYTATYDDFKQAGEYIIYIYANDALGNTSEPKVAKVMVNSALSRKAVIIGGGIEGEDSTAKIEALTEQAYQALRGQGYDDDSIYFLAPTQASKGSVKLNTLGNVELALTTWASDMSSDVLVYVVGPSDGAGALRLTGDNSVATDDEWLSKKQLVLWLNTLQDNVSGTLTIFADYSNAGQLLSSLQSESEVDRIVISSTSSDESALWFSSIAPSFSKYFWSKITTGSDIRDAFFHAKGAVAFPVFKQAPELDANYNGLANEKADSIYARDRRIGVGILTAGDEPVITEYNGSTSDNIVELTEPGTLTLFVNNIVSTSGMRNVVAHILGPNDFSRSVTLKQTEGNNFAVESSDFTHDGQYQVTFEAQNVDGYFATPVSITVNLQTGAGDAYEPDDTPATANVLDLGSKNVVTHNLHKKSDEDWYIFYANRNEDGAFGLELKLQNVGSGIDPQIEFYASDGTTLLAYSDDGLEKEGEVLSLPITEAGLYYVRVLVSPKAENVFDGTKSHYDILLGSTAAGFSGILTGFVTDLTGAQLSKVQITSDEGRGTLSLPNGKYLFTQRSGETMVTFSKEGYTDSVRSITLAELVTISLNVIIEPILLNVAPVINNAPVITSVAVTTAVEKTPYRYSLSGSDADGDTLSFSLNSAHTWLSLDNGVLSGTPAITDVGEHEISLQVSDGSNDETAGSIQTFTLVVTASQAVSLVVTAPEDMTLEATALLTAVELGQATVTGDPDAALEASANNLGPYSLGVHIIIWSVKDSEGNDVSDMQTITIVDTTAPVIEVPELIEIDASGEFTDISLLLSLLATDVVEGSLDVTLDSNVLLPSGLQQVSVSAQDSQGNRSEETVQVAIHPQLMLGLNKAAEKASVITIPIELNGPVALYPVSINYQTDSDGQMDSGEYIIASDTTEPLTLTLANDLLAGANVSVTLLSAHHAALPADAVLNINIVDTNLAPTLTISMQQGGAEATVVNQMDGDITFTANVRDINLGDTHSIVWLNAQGNEIATGATLTLDPSTLTAGQNTVVANVTESNTDDSFSVSVGNQYWLFATLPNLNTGDSDNDGIADVDEGFADDDGDGIANYLDGVSARNQLPASDGLRKLLAPAGIQLRLGASAQLVSAGSGDSVSITEEALIDILGTDMAVDTDYQPILPLIDFVASGLAQNGDSVTLIIALASAQVLPENAVYRKFAPASGWRDFVSDSTNTIASAAVDGQGNCQPFSAVVYQAGLNGGHQCIALFIEDGGQNDNDGLANGIIEDPGAISIAKANLPPIITLTALDTVNEGEQISLDASASTDPEGEPLSYTWQQLSGSPATLLDPTSAVLQLTAANVSADEEIALQLTVSDGVNSATLTQVLTVKFVNQAPQITLSTSSSSELEGGSVTLTASASDADGNSLTYSWAQVSGASVTFANANVTQLSISLPSVTANSTVVMRVTVSDGNTEATSDVSFTVRNQVTTTTPPASDGGGGGGSPSYYLLILLCIFLMYRHHIDGLFNAKRPKVTRAFD